MQSKSQKTQAKADKLLRKVERTGNASTLARATELVRRAERQADKGR
jgi:hypothetical protein